MEWDPEAPDMLDAFIRKILYLTDQEDSVLWERRAWRTNGNGELDSFAVYFCESNSLKHSD